MYCNHTHSYNNKYCVIHLLGVTQEKINISACVNDIPYINSAQEMGVHEWIASVT